MECTKQTDCYYNCGSIYLLTFALAIFFLWLAPVRLGHPLASLSPSPLSHFSAANPTQPQDMSGGEGSAEEYALFLQWLEYHRHTGKYPLAELLLSPKPLPKSPCSPSYSRPPSPSPSLSPSPPFHPSPSPRLPPALPSIKSEASPTPPPTYPPTPLFPLPPTKPTLRFAPGTLVLRRRPSSDFFDAQDRQHPADGPFMLLRTHPFSPTTWQLDIPTGSRMPLWHPEVSLVRWDEGVKEIRCSREMGGGGGREVRVHVKGWGCEDDVWVREDDTWLGMGEGEHRNSL